MNNLYETESINSNYRLVTIFGGSDPHIGAPCSIVTFNPSTNTISATPDGDLVNQGPVQTGGVYTGQPSADDNERMYSYNTFMFQKAYYHNPINVRCLTVDVERIAEVLKQFMKDERLAEFRAARTALKAAKEKLESANNVEISLCL